MKHPAPIYPLYRVTFNRMPHIPWAVQLTPGAPYYATGTLVRRIRTLEQETGEKFATIERHEPPIRRWSGEKLTAGTRVGFYRAGHLGDALCDTAVLAQLYWDYPQVQFHVWAESPQNEVWLNNRTIAGQQARPFMLAISEAEMMSMDYWILPRPLPYLRRTSRSNYYELLEQAVGIEIDIKRPHVYITDDQRLDLRTKFAREFARMAEGEQILDIPYIYVQTTASEQSRTPGGDLAGDYWYERLQALMELLPDHWFFLAGDLDRMNGADGDFLQRCIREPLHTVNVRYMDSVKYKSKVLRVPYSLEMIRKARMVITPDSFAMHAAAAFDVPCLALWNVYGDPEERIPHPLTRLATYPAARVLPMDIDAAALATAVQLMTGD